LILAAGTVKIILKNYKNNSYAFAILYAPLVSQLDEEMEVRTSSELVPL